MFQMHDFGLTLLLFGSETKYFSDLIDFLSKKFDHCVVMESVQARISVSDATVDRKLTSTYSVDRQSVTLECWH